MASRDPYLIGKLGSYDIATVVKIDAHLRNLRARLTKGLAVKQRIAVWHDINALLDRRQAMTADKAVPP